MNAPTDTNTVRVPFDFDSLEIGDTVPAAIVAMAMKTSIEDKSYALKLLQFCRQAHARLSERFGRHIDIVCRKGAAYVVPDSERTELAIQRQKAYQQKMRLTARSLKDTDLTDLSDEVRRRHELMFGLVQRQIIATTNVRLAYFKDPDTQERMKALPPQLRIPK